MATLTPLFTPGIGRVVVSPIDDAESAVSTVLVANWNVVDRVSFSAAFTWKIEAQGISAQKASAFNARKRMSVYPQYVKYGIGHAVSWPIDYNTFIPGVAWNIDRRFSTSAKFSWKIIGRISSQKKTSFNVLITRYTNDFFSWNTRLKVSKPGFSNANWFNRVLSPVTHPVDNADHQVNSYYQYNVAKRISASQTIRFNDRIKVKSSVVSSFKVVTTHVIAQKSFTWEDMMRL